MADTFNILDESAITGSWTPVFLFGTSTGTITYTQQVGYYSKLNKTIFIQGNIRVSSIGTSTGTVKIGGLPFIASNIIWNSGVVSYATGLSVISAQNLNLYSEKNTNELNITIWDSSTGISFLMDSDFGSNTHLLFSIQYFID